MPFSAIFFCEKVQHIMCFPHTHIYRYHALMQVFLNLYILNVYFYNKRAFYACNFNAL